MERYGAAAFPIKWCHQRVVTEDAEAARVRGHQVSNQVVSPASGDLTQYVQFRSERSGVSNQVVSPASGDS